MCVRKVWRLRSRTREMKPQLEFAAFNVYFSFSSAVRYGYCFRDETKQHSHRHRSASSSSSFVDNVVVVQDNIGIIIRSYPYTGGQRVHCTAVRLAYYRERNRIAASRMKKEINKRRFNVWVCSLCNAHSNCVNCFELFCRQSKRKKERMRSGYRSSVNDFWFSWKAAESTQNVVENDEDHQFNGEPSLKHISIVCFTRNLYIYFGWCNRTESSLRWRKEIL